VTFKMLMKRGGRDDRTKELHVSVQRMWSRAPVTCSMHLQSVSLVVPSG
jgi:hypothetical protein